MTQTHTPICPKCGYDQSGEIATWSTQCPLTGTCPECGLDFQWFNVLNPDHTKIHWYTEHAPNFISTIKRTPSTLLRLILPPIFWRRIPITAAITIPMLIKWCFLLILIAHLLASVCSGFGRWKAIDSWYYGTVDRIYSVGGLMGITEIIINALFAPFITVSPTGAGVRQMTIQLGSPYGESVEKLIVIPSLALGATLFWFLVMVVIPTTRRLSKLRFVHLSRAFILCFTAVVLHFEFIRGISGLDMFAGSRTGWHDTLQIYSIFIMLLWHLLFWPSAIFCTWKIRPAWLLIILGSIAAFLGALVTIFFIGNLFS